MAKNISSYSYRELVVMLIRYESASKIPIPLLYKDVRAEVQNRLKVRYSQSIQTKTQLA